MKKLGLLCVLLGALLLVGAGTWYAYNESDDMRAGAEAQEALTRLRSAIDGGEAGDAPLEAEGPPHASPDASSPATLEDESVQRFAPMRTVVIDGYTYIGYLSVPEIKLNLPVQATWSEKLLERSPCWYAGSLSQSDLIVAGHNYKRHFTPLKQVSVGAQVIFTDVDGVEYHYVVSKIVTVAGDDAPAMLADVENWDLTLFTCTYGGGSRLALRCVLQKL